MEGLLEIIEELLHDKAKLEEEKASNLEKIKLYEQKISYFTNLYMQNNAYAIVYQRQIDSYERLNDFSEESSFPLKMFDDSLFNSYSKKRIKELHDKRKKVLHRKKVASGCISYYEERREDFVSRNTEIDEEIADIDRQLDEAYIERDTSVIKDSDEKILERGNKNDRY